MKSTLYNLALVHSPPLWVTQICALLTLPTLHQTQLLTVPPDTPYDFLPRGFTYLGPSYIVISQVYFQLKMSSSSLSIFLISWIGSTISPEVPLPFYL